MRAMGRFRVSGPVLAALAAASVAAIPSAAVAQTPYFINPTEPLLNYAFASQLGSGIYSVNGRTVQIYGIPVRFTAIPAEGRAWGLDLTMPVTLGFFDFKTKDLANLDLPTHIGTASVMPGVHFKIPREGGWTIEPYAEIGAAKDFEGGQTAWVWTTGLRNEWLRPWQGFEWLIVNDAFWAGADAPDSDRLDYVEIRTGTEFGRMFRAEAREGRHEWDWTVYAASYYYPSNLVLVSGNLGEETVFEGHWQWEIGATFGVRPRKYLWKIPLPRIGLGYRFGDGVQAVRLVFGRPF